MRTPDEKDLVRACIGATLIQRMSLCATEFDGISFDELVHDRRRFPAEFEQVVGETVLTALSVQRAHRREMPDEMFGRVEPGKS